MSSFPLQGYSSVYCQGLPIGGRAVWGPLLSVGPAATAEPAKTPTRSKKRYKFVKNYIFSELFAQNVSIWYEVLCYSLFVSINKCKRPFYDDNVAGAF
jgi:hypothetical protein